MKLGRGAESFLSPWRQSLIGLGILVLATFLLRADLAGAVAGGDGDQAILERKTPDHHHLHGKQHQQELHHHHVFAEVDKLHPYQQKHLHVKRSQLVPGAMKKKKSNKMMSLHSHHRHRHGSHHSKGHHHHHKKHGKKQQHRQNKKKKNHSHHHKDHSHHHHEDHCHHHKDHVHHHHNNHCKGDHGPGHGHRHKDKCNGGNGGHEENKNDTRPRIASFGILECNNKTISAVYCPIGTLVHPGTQIKDFGELFGISALNKKRRPLNDTSEYSDRLAYLDVIHMDAPCPKPAKKDIFAAMKRLTPQDRKLIAPYFSINFYATNAHTFDRHQTDGDCDGETGGHWHDKCTSVGVFCGIDLFGCETIDDGLYECKVVGEKPSMLEMCAVGECVSHGHDGQPASCRQGDCVCSESGQICGSEFVPECGFKEGSLYFCKGHNDTPIFVNECQSGSCPRGSNSCEPPHVTDPPECLCQNQGPICGSTFPPQCRVSASDLYLCTANGSLPLAHKKCESGVCEKGETVCKVEITPPTNDCICQSTSLICGPTFPASCELDSSSLYNCTAGKKPMLATKCESGTCLANATTCYDGGVTPPPPENPCDCHFEGQICGSSFPPDCGRDPESLFHCKIGHEPKWIVRCLSGICPVNGTVCDRDPCLCTDGQNNICGSTFPEKCCLKDDALYLCTGEGTKPGFISTCISKKCDANATACTLDPCACTKPGTICGATFEDSCEYDKKALYSCTAAGVLPVKNYICASKSCPAGELVCDPDPCACIMAGDICGSAFPKSCGIDPESLHNCKKPGESPTLIEKCGSKSCPSNSSKCDEDPCACKAFGRICGSSFPVVCGLDGDTVYSCAGEGRVPIEDERCNPGACPGDGKACVIDPCECPGSDSLCGGNFPTDCKLLNNTIYTCDGPGTTPQPAKHCRNALCILGTGNCEVDPCLCPTEGTICGSSFPRECELDPKTLYTCGTAGSDPQFPMLCLSSSCPINGTVCGAFDACQCSIEGKTCGSSFLSACGYDEDTLYYCTLGAKPVDINKCFEGSCLFGTETCDIFEPYCACEQSGDICGSTFPATCRLSKDSLYSCGSVGMRPTEIAPCPSGSCPIDADLCAAIDQCDCVEQGHVCGSTFADTCTHIKEGLYECANVGDHPALIETCKSKLCKSGDNKCGDIDRCACEKVGQVCGATYPDTCHYEPNSLYYCKDEGDIPEKVHQCFSGSCPRGATACDLDPCACSSSGSICGSTFPLSCKYEQTGLYFCVAVGQHPVFTENCPSKECLPSSQKCSDVDRVGCLCTREEQICGSSFGPTCNMDRDTLYYCPDVGSMPEAIETCKPNSCQRDAHNCNRAFYCDCKGPGTPCGWEFLSECRMDADTSYYCGEAGDTPIPLHKFTPGTCLPDVSGRVQDPCACPGNGTICGSSLDMSMCSKIAVKPNMVYRCEHEEYPVEIKFCSPSRCVQQSTGAVCQSDPCSCTKEGAYTCGSSIDSKCKLRNDTSYICQGSKFVLADECSFGCLAIDGKCLDKCSCKSPGIVCGSQFPGCSLSNTSLYSCLQDRRPVLLGTCFSGTCEVRPLEIPPPPSYPPIFRALAMTQGDYNDTCGPNPCYCKPGQELFCDETMKAECNPLTDELLSCPGPGGPPVPVKGCSPMKCETLDGMHKCQRDPCRCGDEQGTFCGSNFPEECHYPPNTVFTCKQAGTAPRLAAACDPQSCIFANGTASCAKDPCVCSNANSTVCTTDFPQSCNLTPNTVYACADEGAIPQAIQVCNPEKCVFSEDQARCDKNPCLCNGESPGVCGSDFPERCGTKVREVYKCSGLHAIPELLRICENSRCEYQDGLAVCKRLICQCLAVNVSLCGSQTPEACGHKPNAIYTCEKIGDLWVEKEECVGSVCLADGLNPSCSMGECLCRPGDVGKSFCGVDFAAQCGLQPHSIYSCEVGGEKPKIIGDCGASKCSRNTTAGVAYCESFKCKCEAGWGTICGAQLPGCGLEDNAVFECGGNKGDVPKFKHDCKPDLCIYNQIDGATCRADPCRCQEGEKSICGSTFPPECGYAPNNLYSCSGRASAPAMSLDCSPSECAQNGPIAICVNDCYCPDTNDICGKSFPPKCGLNPGWIFSCENPWVPVVKEECSRWGCTGINSVQCSKSPCTCDPGRTEMCGWQFKEPLCGYENNTLYSCEDPEKPAIKFNCAPNTCVMTPEAEAHCYEDPCSCKDGMQRVCGSVFPESCNTRADSVYDCRGLKDPVRQEDCNAGDCFKEASGNVLCRDHECHCRKDMTSACSSDYPAKCNLSSSVVYGCMGIQDELRPVTDCGKDGVCQVVVSGMLARCKPDPCVCEYSLVGKSVCARQFPLSCGYNPDALYFCERAMQPPKIIDDCAPFTCNVDGGVGECQTNPCRCQVGQEMVCGSEFPIFCTDINSQAVYGCFNGAGNDPAMITSCSPQGCTLGSNGKPKCEPNPCLCSESKLGVCGSSYPATCGLDPDSFYTCGGEGVIPFKIAKCALGGCDPRTATCIPPPCACKSVGDSCGSDYDVDCGFKPDTLYTCSKSGVDPVPKADCQAGCVKGSGECTIPPPDPCLCTGVDLRCGSAFPPECPYNGDSLYECTGLDTRPNLKENCIVGGCVTGSDACAPDPCDCVSFGMFCGKDFLPECGYDRNKIYGCSFVSKKPEPVRDCPDERCGYKPQFDVVKVVECLPDCTCAKEGDICGADLNPDPHCDFTKDVLYSCSAVGVAPTPKEICRGGCNPGESTCFADPCLCKAVGVLCGKDFDSRCKALRNDTSYACRDSDMLPIVGKACPEGGCHGGTCSGDAACTCLEDGPFCGRQLECTGVNPDIYYACSKGGVPHGIGTCENDQPVSGRCLCVDAYSMCSSFFPFECGYRQDQVMTCPGGRGSKPYVDQQCGMGRCTAQRTCDKNCLCDSVATKCGKQYDPSCGYDESTLYSCALVGAIPKAGKKCLGGPENCSATMGIGRCLGDCECKDVDPVCGAAFPAHCNYKAGSIYRCDYAGAFAVAPKKCSIPCYPQHGPDKCGAAFF